MKQSYDSLSCQLELIYIQSENEEIKSPQEAIYQTCLAGWTDMDRWTDGVKTRHDPCSPQSRQQLRCQSICLKLGGFWTQMLLGTQSFFDFRGDFISSISVVIYNSSNSQTIPKQIENTLTSLIFRAKTARLPKEH